MKSYYELKAVMEAIRQQMIEAKMDGCTNAIKEANRLCEEFIFSAGMLKDPLAKGKFN